MSPATERVRVLAEPALDLGLTKPARIGFQMLSYLRWESALVDVRSGVDDVSGLQDAVDQVRTADAKYELSYLLSRWAVHAVGRGDLDAAEGIAQDAVQVSHAIGRVSELAIALEAGKSGFARAPLTNPHGCRCPSGSR